MAPVCAVSPKGGLRGVCLNRLTLSRVLDMKSQQIGWTGLDFKIVFKTFIALS